MKNNQKPYVVQVPVVFTQADVEKASWPETKKAMVEHAARVIDQLIDKATEGR